MRDVIKQVCWYCFREKALIDYIVNNEGSTQPDGEPPYQSERNAAKNVLCTSPVLLMNV